MSPRKMSPHNRPTPRSNGARSARPVASWPLRLGLATGVAALIVGVTLWIGLGNNTPSRVPAKTPAVETAAEDSMADFTAPENVAVSAVAPASSIPDVELDALLDELESPNALRIRGRVITPDGEPIAGAVVSTRDKNPLAQMLPRLRNGSSRPSTTARSDGEGRFVLNANTTPGRLRIEHDDYVSLTLRELPPLQAGADHDLGDLVIEPGARVVGIVLDSETGEPIADAKVEVRKLTEEGASLPPLPFRRGKTSTTDREGRFVVSPVEPGRHRVSVSAPGYLPFRGEPVELEAGETHEVEVEVIEGVSLSGTVVDADGEPVVARVRVVPEGRMALPFSGEGERVETDEEGRFTVTGLDPEKLYRVRAKQEGSPTATLGDVEPGSDDLLLELTAYGSVIARVYDENGRPIPEFSAQLRKAEGPSLPRPFGPFAKRRFEEGVATFDSIPPAEYQVTVESEGWSEVRSDRFAVVPGEEYELEITLRIGSRIEGIVEDMNARPIEGARVRIYVPAEKPRRIARVRTDENGRYEIEDLAPGTYELRVTHREYAPLSQTIEVSAADSVLPPVALDAGSRVVGSVVDEAGNPVSRGFVRLSPVDGGRPLRGLIRDGAFERGGVPVGTYDVVATSAADMMRRRLENAPSNPSNEQRIRVTASQDTEIEIQLRSPSPSDREDQR